MKLREFFSLLNHSKYLILGIIAIFLSLALLTNSLSTPRYPAKVTFYLNGDVVQGGLASGILGLNPNDLQKKIFALVKSNLMKNAVAEQFKFQFHKSTKATRGLLGLDGRVTITVDENAVNVLSYQHKDPKIAYAVVNEYIAALKRLNEELNLSGKKDFIMVLDEPEIPTSPVSPQKAMNIILAIFSGTFLGILFVLIRRFYFEEDADSKIEYLNPKE